MHVPNIRRKIAREDRPPNRRPELLGPVPTLGELHAARQHGFGLAVRASTRQANGVSIGSRSRSLPQLGRGSSPTSRWSL
jgi:hypothetical protein